MNTEEQIAALNAGLRDLARSANERLSESTGGGAEDVEGVREGLRDALDVGRLLCRATDQGVPILEELFDAVETLVRTTLQTTPHLHESEMAALIAGDETAGYVSSLRSRSQHASLALHQGLDVAYRSRAAAEEEV